MLQAELRGGLLDHSGRKRRGFFRMAFRVAPGCVDMTARANIQMQKAGTELVCQFAALLPASDLERWMDITDG